MARGLRASPLLRRIAAAWEDGRLILTGGSLRDRLLGLGTHDLDFVVQGDTRGAAYALASELGGSCFPLGKPPLVTWRVVAGGLQLDLSPPQGSLDEDILRRDFTVNALFWGLPRGPLVDLVGGVEDLASGRLRVVREENLHDDPLRVLRGVRIAATRPMLRLTAEAEHQLAAAAPGLVGVARERILEELRLTLTGQAVARALLTAARCNLFTPVLPGWASPECAAEIAVVADRLAHLARSMGGALGEGARAIHPAVLAAPAAGFPLRWEIEAAANALTLAGWAPRSSRSIAQGAALGERILPLLARGGAELRALAAQAGPHLEEALAWAAGRALAAGEDPLPRAACLLRWWRRFSAAPPLLSGAEVADALALPEGPARAEAVRSLRLAQARGSVRTARGARRFLNR